MIEQTYNLNLIPNGVPVIVKASQYDKTARTIKFTIYDGDTLFTIPAGADVYVQGTKPDLTGYQYSCTVNGSVVSFDIEQQMTVCAGRHFAEIRITKGGEILGTANFEFFIERSALSDDTVISETDLPKLEFIFDNWDSKMDKVDNPNAGDILIVDANGQAIDSDVDIEQLLDKSKFTWRQIQTLVRNGKIQDWFEIGDQITVTYTDPNTNTEYECPFH